MLPGIVDTAMNYGQSVYANGLPFDQLSAMPSVHVAWAVLVGWYVWQVSPSRWRFLGPLHGVLTVIVVVVTGNHWWLDGIVAVLILSVGAWGVYGVRLAWLSAPDRLRPAPALVETADVGRDDLDRTRARRRSTARWSAPTGRSSRATWPGSAGPSSTSAPA